LHSSPLSIPDHALGTAFSITLNTLALYQSTLWWFDALPCRTTPVGRFHHLINSCVTIFSRSLLSAHIKIVRFYVRLFSEGKSDVTKKHELSIKHLIKHYFYTVCLLHKLPKFVNFMVCKAKKTIRKNSSLLLG